jgi:hypothetical protein
MLLLWGGALKFGIFGRLGTAIIDADYKPFSKLKQRSHIVRQ